MLIFESHGVGRNIIEPNSCVPGWNEQKLRCVWTKLHWWNPIIWSLVEFELVWSRHLQTIKHRGNFNDSKNTRLAGEQDWALWKAAQSRPENLTAFYTEQVQNTQISHKLSNSGCQSLSKTSINALLCRALLNTNMNKQHKNIMITIIIYKLTYKCVWLCFLKSIFISYCEHQEVT